METAQRHDADDQRHQHEDALHEHDQRDLLLESVAVRAEAVERARVGGRQDEDEDDGREHKRDRDAERETAQRIRQLGTGDGPVDPRHEVTLAEPEAVIQSGRDSGIPCSTSPS